MRHSKGDPHISMTTARAGPPPSYGPDTSDVCIPIYRNTRVNAGCCKHCESPWGAMLGQLKHNAPQSCRQALAYSCTGQHTLELERSTPLTWSASQHHEVTQVSDGHRCTGSAGSQQAFQEDIARLLNPPRQHAAAPLLTPGSKVIEKNLSALLLCPCRAPPIMLESITDGTGMSWKQAKIPRCGAVLRGFPWSLMHIWSTAYLQSAPMPQT